ncbi:MAG: hypothetical protein QOE89_2905, partial [Pseudonocardiales bacterium]|nr:hypothetical protein [Pseudonocardiales bacterium]
TGAGAATPVEIQLQLTGLSSAACPLPVNSSIGLSPQTTVKLVPGITGIGVTVSVSPDPSNAKATAPKKYDLPAAGVNVALTRNTTYTLTWNTSLAILDLRQSAKLVTDSSATKAACLVGISVPTPSIQTTLVPPAVKDPVNGAVSSAVGGVNQGIAPINGILGPVVGGVPGGKPTTAPAPGSTSTTPGSVLGYKPTGLTPADKTVPKGGTGGGTGGTYVAPGLDGSINAPALGVNGGDAKATAANSTAKPKPAPSSVDLASSTDRSAISGLPSLLVVLAVIALSAATAFYARTFLWHRPQAAKRGA